MEENATDHDSLDAAAIYDEHAQAVYYLALRYLGNATRAEDATHDVFLKAIRKLRSFRGESSVRTWLYRITVNHCMNLQKSWQRRHIHSSSDEQVFESAADSDNGPIRVLETKELGARIQRTLDELPEEYRLLLLLVADEDLSYAEVAEVTGQSVDAVRGKLHRARRAFTSRFRKLH